MEYAILGKTGLRVSRLGFGCMRFPMKNSTEVDRDVVIPMLRRAVELGVNYFDTAVGYCGDDSQNVLGEAMEDVRDQVILSTKNPHYDKADKAGWWKNLENSLERLRVDCIDVYNMHGMNYEKFERSLAGEDGLYKELLKAKEQGLIAHICHSFHGDTESLKKCVDTGLFESVTLQYNLLDRSLEEGIAYAAEHGMGITVMGPVGGGKLGYPSERVREIVGDVKSTPALALRFVLANPNVTLALSGMQNMQMLEENVETVCGSATLTPEENVRIAAAFEERRELAGLYCTGCKYCMPCPAGVDIPACFEILNLERVYGLTDLAKERYKGLAGGAVLCRLCGKCLEPCPQDLEIPTRLAEAVALLDARAGTVAGWADLLGASPSEAGLVKLDLQYNVKNFTDEAQTVVAEFRPRGEVQVAPLTVEFGELKAAGRREEKLEVLIRPPLEALDFDVLLQHGGAQTDEHLHYVIAVAQRAEGHELRADAERADVLSVPGERHGAEAPAGHSFDFTVTYDDENLYLWADVRDDLLYPATDEVKRWWQAADNLRIFLDGREPAAQGRGGFQRGVCHITLFPPADEGAEMKARNFRARGEARTVWTRTPGGYRVDCAVPWELFSEVEGVPKVIGFDLMQQSYNAEGKDKLVLTWTGREDQQENTGAFGKLLLL